MTRSGREYLYNQPRNGDKQILRTKLVWTASWDQNKADGTSAQGSAEGGEDDRGLCERE